MSMKKVKNEYEFKRLFVKQFIFYYIVAQEDFLPINKIISFTESAFIKIFNVYLIIDILIRCVK